VNEEAVSISPIADWIYVERVREKVTAGGIYLPETFKAGKHGHSAREKMNAVPDHFMARVLATGPAVQRSEAHGLFQGDMALVWSYADGDGSKLYTGESVGERDRLFIKPKDVVCALDP